MIRNQLPAEETTHTPTLIALIRQAKPEKIGYFTPTRESPHEPTWRRKLDSGSQCRPDGGGENGICVARIL